MGIYNLGGGGGTPVLEARTVTPSTSQQIIKPSRDEYDGLSQVTVEATPLETRTVNPSTSSQTITPSGSNIGFSTVTVNPYRLQSKTVNLTSDYAIYTPDSVYDGFSQIIVKVPSTTNLNSFGGTLYPPASYTCSFVKSGDFSTEISVSFNDSSFLDRVFILILHGTVLCGVDQIQERFTLVYLPFADSKYWRTEDTGTLTASYGNVVGNTITFAISQVAGDGIYAMGALYGMKMTWGVN